MFIHFHIHIVVNTPGSYTWAANIKLWLWASFPATTITPHYTFLPATKL